MPSKKGERKRRPLNWEDEHLQHVLALKLEGRKSSESIAQDIAKDCRIPARTIRDWIAHPEFQAKLAEMRADLLKSSDVLGKAYVRKEQRVFALSDMAERARVQFEERPLLVERRQIGRDDDGPLYMENESFNRDAHAAFRDSLKEIADELGDRKQKIEHGGNPDAPLVVWAVPQKPR